MQLKISSTGGIARLNAAGEFHSFDDKPSYINSSGDMWWHDNGQLIKYRSTVAAKVVHYSSGRQQ